MRPSLTSWRIPCGLSCEMLRAVQKGLCSSSSSTGRFSWEFQGHLPHIMAASSHDCSWKHRGSKDGHRGHWIAGTVDSLTIKAGAVRVLMLFLTSRVPLPVILSKVIIRMLLEFSWIKVWPSEYQVFLLFALLWSRSQFPHTAPLMSHFYEVDEAVFLLRVSVPDVLLFERKKSISNYPAVNIKMINVLFGQKICFLKVLSTLFHFHLPERIRIHFYVIKNKLMFLRKFFFPDYKVCSFLFWE